MDSCIVYLTISLMIFSTLWQPRHTASIRKSRIATDFEDDPTSRKMVPKSVFIAPTFGCPPGYLMNYDRRCLQIIRISLNNQYDFILARLNLKTNSINEDEEIFVRNKKDIQEDTGEISTVQPTTNALRYNNNVRPVKNTSKRKTNRITEGPVKIDIPIS